MKCKNLCLIIAMSTLTQHMALAAHTQKESTTSTAPTTIKGASSTPVIPTSTVTPTKRGEREGIYPDATAPFTTVPTPILSIKYTLSPKATSAQYLAVSKKLAEVLEHRQPPLTIEGAGFTAKTLQPIFNIRGNKPIIGKNATAKLTWAVGIKYLRDGGTLTNHLDQLVRFDVAKKVFITSDQNGQIEQLTSSARAALFPPNINDATNLKDAKIMKEIKKH